MNIILNLMLKAPFTVAADDKLSDTFLDLKALHWIKIGNQI